MGIYFLSRHGRSGGRGTLPPAPVWATSWAGAPDASASILTRDGIEIRRNLQPRCRTTATSRILGLATTTASAGWGGIAPVVSIIDDPTAPSGSGKVARITHTDAGTTAAWRIGEVGAPMRLTWAAAGEARRPSAAVARMSLRMSEQSLR